MTEPMHEQIAAHERVEQLRSQLAGAEADGDVAAAKRLSREYERAKREWHKLVREAQGAMRTKRPR